jgi:hypothetical protein
MGRIRMGKLPGSAGGAPFIPLGLFIKPSRYDVDHGPGHGHRLFSLGPPASNAAAGLGVTPWLNAATVIFGDGYV